MLLRDWLRDNKIKQGTEEWKGFADLVGVGESYLVAIAYDTERNPNPKIAKKIEALTNGLVSRLEVLYMKEYKEAS